MKPITASHPSQMSRSRLLLVMTHSVRALGAAASSIATICLLSDLGQAENRAVVVTSYMLCRQLPFLIGSLVVGVFPRSCKQLWNMLICEGLTAASALVLATASRPSQLTTIFVLLIMQRTLAVLFDAARRSLVSEFLSAEQVHRSPQRSDGMAWGFCSALGAVCGGVLVATCGTSPCFLLDASCRLLSALMLLCVDARPSRWAKVPQHDDEEEEHEECKDGPAAAATSPTKYDRNRGSLRTLCGAVGYVRGTEGTLKLSMIKGSAAFVYGASELINWAHSESVISLPRGIVLGVLMAALPLACWMNAVMFSFLARKSLVLPVPHVTVVAMALAAVGSALQTVSSGLAPVFLCSFLRALACAFVWAVACSAQEYPENHALLEAVQALDDATCRTSKVLGLATLGLMFCSYDLCVPQGLEVLGGVTGLLALLWLTLLIKPQDWDEWDEEVELTMINTPRTQHLRKPRRSYSWMKLPSVPEEDEEDIEEDGDDEMKVVDGGWA